VDAAGTFLASNLTAAQGDGKLPVDYVGRIGYISLGWFSFLPE
jgi:hypothetical protein